MPQTIRQKGIFWLAALLVFSLLQPGVSLQAAEDTPLVLAASDIAYGQTLSQSKVTAKTEAGETVQGSYEWSSPQTKPPVGTNSYEVTFTPSSVPEDIHYTNTTAMVSVTVTASTASLVGSAAAALPDGASVQDIDALADAMRGLSSNEKKRLSRSAITRLSRLYNNVHGCSERVEVYSGDFSSSRRIPDNGESECYGAAIAAGITSGTAVIEIDQKSTSGSEVLRFTASGSGSPASPVVLWVALPDNISTSRDYYIRSDAGTLDCSIERYSGASQYFAVFTAPSLGTFRLFRESSSNDDDDDDDDDDDYEVSSFWEAVIDRIMDADNGDVIRVNAGARTTMAADVLRELKGQRITLVIRRNNADTISIYGKDIKSVPSTRDYYTLKTLAALYHAQESSSSAPASSAPEAVSQPQSSSAPAPQAPAPVVWTPPVQQVVSSSTPVSSLPEPEESDEESDIEIEAEEDEPFHEEEESKPQEETGAGPSSRISFGLFVVAVVALSAAASGGITFAVWSRRRRNYL